MQTFTV